MLSVDERATLQSERTAIDPETGLWRISQSIQKVHHEGDTTDPRNESAAKQETTIQRWNAAVNAMNKPCEGGTFYWAALSRSQIL